MEVVIKMAITIDQLKKRPSTSYWQRRMELLEKAQINKGQAYFADLEKQYRIASQNIEKELTKWYSRFATNNNITMVEARRLLSTKELAEFKWNVEEYIKYGEKNALNPLWMKELENASARVHVSRLESLKIQMQQQVEVLYGNQTDGFDKLLKDVYTDGYFHTAYEIQKGFNIGWDLHDLNSNQLDKVLSKPWTTDGKTFSDRIWTHKQQLLGELQTGLTQAVIRGEAPDKLIKDISKRFDVTKNKAGRLVMTESAAFASASQKDCFNDLNVEQYEILATLDNRTSAICQELDGKVISMKDYEVGVTAPPFHAWCRTTTIPYFEDNYGERAARDVDGKVYYVPSTMKYKDWKESFVDGEKGGLEEVISGKIKEKFIAAKTIQEAEEYARNILGIPNVNYKGVDVETANRWNEGLKDNFDRFPELSKNFGFIGECHERNTALKPIAKQYYLDELKKANPNHSVQALEPYATKKTNSLMRRMGVSKKTFAESWSPTHEPFSNFRGITVNRDWGKNSDKFVEALKNNVENKFHPIGCDTIRSVLDHEIGHQLDDLLGIRDKDVIKKLFDDRTYSELTEQLSKYSWSNDNPNRYSEMIAEAWAEYTNNDNPREIAKTVGETIEHEYKMKFDEEYKRKYYDNWRKENEEKLKRRGLW